MSQIQWVCVCTRKYIHAHKNKKFELVGIAVCEIELIYCLTPN